MSYGHPGWVPWVLGEDEGIEHIKFACGVAPSISDVLSAHSIVFPGTTTGYRRSTQLMHGFDPDRWMLTIAYTPRIVTGVLQWTLRGDPWKRDQETEPAS